jgi:DNA end-binding protein Ku
LRSNPRGKGLLGITLRFPYEIRNEEEYFGDIMDARIPKDILELAIHIVKRKARTSIPRRSRTTTSSSS